MNLAFIKKLLNANLFATKKSSSLLVFELVVPINLATLNYELYQWLLVCIINFPS